MVVYSVVAIPHKASMGCPTKMQPRPLPKDFTTQELPNVDEYFLGDFSRDEKIDDDEKYFEAAQMTEKRIKRMLWLACRRATPDKCLTYDSTAHRFGVAADDKSSLSSTPLGPGRSTDVSGKKMASANVSVISPKSFESNHDRGDILNHVDVVPRDKYREGRIMDSPSQHLHTDLKAMYAQGTPNLLMILLVTIVFLPVAAAAVTISPGFRILAGIGATGTAVAVIPLRTLPEVDNTAWILTYVVWAVFFSGYLGMQIMLIPSEMSYRRKWFLSCVIIAAVHFSIGLAQTSTTLEDAFTIFGPLIATLCTYVVSLIFGGGDSDIDNNTRREGVTMARASLCA